MRLWKHIGLVERWPAPCSGAAYCATTEEIGSKNNVKELLNDEASKLLFTGAEEELSGLS